MPNGGPREVTFEELVYSNMILVQALVDELVAKGLIDHQTVLARVRKLKKEAGSLRFLGPDEAPAQAVHRPRDRMVSVSFDDLVSANKITLEMLMAILVDKGFLTQAELEELKADFREKMRSRTRRQ
jgi:hypothetical protein